MTVLIPAWVDGRLTPVDKLQVHRRGLRHKAVSVFLTQGDRILLQRRAMAKYHTPGLWANACCTHPFWGEEPATCAVRRLQDELGLRGQVPVWRHRLEYRADVGGGLTEHEQVEVYALRVDSPPVLDPDPAEVMDTRWIGFHELQSDLSRQPEIYTPWLRIYMADHAERILGRDLDTGPPG